MWFGFSFPSGCFTKQPNAVLVAVLGTPEYFVLALFTRIRTANYSPVPQVPARFYCPLCIKQEKDKACENPCLACKSNDRDDLVRIFSLRHW